MRKHLVLTGCIGLFFLFALSGWAAGIPPAGPTAPRVAAAPPGSTSTGNGVVAYYFHVKVRCQTCLLIEQRSSEVIKGAFGKELEEGVLAWQVVNTQQPENRWFTTELRLPSRGLVLVAYQDGKPGRSKVLEGVWQQIYGEPAAFRQYLTREVRDFLDQKP